MTPTKAQLKWLETRIPHNRGRVKVLDVIPRAYCIAKPAVECAVVVTRPCDYLFFPRHLEADAINCQGVLFQEATAADLRVGDWLTLVYGALPTQGKWYLTRPMPVELCWPGKKKGD